MKFPIKLGTILLLYFWINTAQAKNELKCIGDEPNDPEYFLLEHLEEIAFVRDSCVELARNLTQKLKIPVAIKSCEELANIQTSAAGFPEKKWKRTDNTLVNDEVLQKALAMMKDFNSENREITYILDQKFILECIDTAITRLINSKAVDFNSDLIREMDQLKKKFCQTYMDRISLEAAAMLQVQKRLQEISRQKALQKEMVREIPVKYPTSAEYKEYDEMIKTLDKEWPLHELVFKHNVKILAYLLKKKEHNVNKKDKHGNTALHLAVILGRRVCIALLLEHGALVGVRNLGGWSPLEEAISYGHRETVVLLWRTFNQQLRQDVIEKKKKLKFRLMEIDDFEMILKWEFSSTPVLYPFVYLVLPRDTYTILKHGTSIRLNHGLYKLKITGWEYRNMAVLFDANNPNPSLIQVDHTYSTYGEVEQEKTEEQLQFEVDKMMSKDIGSIVLPTDKITIKRTQQYDWRGKNPKDKHAKIGEFEADFYDMNISIDARKRREHLTIEEIKQSDSSDVIEFLVKNKLPTSFKRGKVTEGKTLNPPPQTDVSWNKYINSEHGKCPILGRKMDLKENELKFKTEFGLSEDFPLSIELVLDILEVIAPIKQYADLRKFVEEKLTGKFPVYVEVPIMASVYLKFTIIKFEKKKISEDLFRVPAKYQEIAFSTTGAKSIILNGATLAYYAKGSHVG